MRGLILISLALTALSGMLSGADAPETVSTNDSGLDAYRAADYASASVFWERDLAEAEASGAHPAERARLCYDLGNCAYRQNEPETALAWYEAALRLSPRDADTWHNLELVRGDLGLAPRDDGSLDSTFARLTTSLTGREARWLVLAALVLLAACLGFEALRGGVLWQGLSWLAVLLLCVSLVPWYRTSSAEQGRPLLVVQKGGASARAEPRPEAKTLVRLAIADHVQHLDDLPGWTRVRTSDGRELWVMESAVFDIAR